MAQTTVDEAKQLRKEIDFLSGLINEHKSAQRLQQCMPPGRMVTGISHRTKHQPETHRNKQWVNPLSSKSVMKLPNQSAIPTVPTLSDQKKNRGEKTSPRTGTNCREPNAVKGIRTESTLEVSSRITSRTHKSRDQFGKKLVGIVASSSDSSCSEPTRMELSKKVEIGSSTLSKETRQPMVPEMVQQHVPSQRTKLSANNSGVKKDNGQGSISSAATVVHVNPKFLQLVQSKSKTDLGVASHRSTGKVNDHLTKTGKPSVAPTANEGHATAGKLGIYINPKFLLPNMLSQDVQQTRLTESAPDKPQVLKQLISRTTPNITPKLTSEKSGHKSSNCRLVDAELLEMPGVKPKAKHQGELSLACSEVGSSSWSRYKFEKKSNWPISGSQGTVSRKVVRTRQLSAPSLVEGPRGTSTPVATRSSRYRLVKTHTQPVVSTEMFSESPSLALSMQAKEMPLSKTSSKGKLATPYRYIAKNSPANVVEKRVDLPSVSPIVGASFKLLSRYRIVKKAIQTSVHRVRKERRLSSSSSRSSPSSTPVSSAPPSFRGMVPWKPGHGKRFQHKHSIRKSNDAGPFPGSATGTGPGKKTWVKKFSLKRDPEAKPIELSVNQILGRRVANVSKNKFKFIKARSTNKGGSYVKRRKLGSQRVAVKKSSLKIDRRQSARKQSNVAGHHGRGQCRQKVVLISGQTYKVSKNKLTKASPKITTRENKVGMKKHGTKYLRGIPYNVHPSGRSLARVLTGNGQCPKRISVGGVAYIQTKPGTLIRSTAHHSRVLASRAVQRSIHTTVMSRYKKSNKNSSSSNKNYCLFYNRYGRCNRGKKCHFSHDPDKVAVCTRFLRGTCQVTSCPFSHKVAKEKMPVCRFFLKGVCNGDRCPYLHVNVARDADVCKDFQNGYCPLADKCKKKHILRTHRSRKSRARQDTSKPSESQAKSHTTKRLHGNLQDATQSSPPKKCKIENMSLECEEDDVSKPLKHRTLPSFISIGSSMDQTESQDITSGTESLQIHPRLSFKGDD